MLGRVFLCSSELRVVWGDGVGDLVRLAADAGFDGVAIGDRCARADAAALVVAAAAAGLTVPVAPGLVPDSAPAPDKRLPRLASVDDADERRAAIALFAATVDAMVPLGVRLFTVELAVVSLRTPPDAVAWRFARGELAEDEPGERVWAAAIGERKARGIEIVDACRSCLDRLMPLAERRDVTVALEIAAGPWTAPTPREALELIDDYREAPIGLVWDRARIQVLASLGLGPSQERRTGLRAAARAWRENEAVGIEPGYLPGLGDPADDDAITARDAGAAPIEAAVEAPVIVTGFRDSTPAEVARARVLAATRASRATGPRSAAT